MTKSYTVKYRQPGQIFWRKVRNVVADGIEVVLGDASKGRLYRWFERSNRELICISLDAEVVFPARRSDAILERLSRESGQHVTRSER